jgi:hypothetical protein
MAFLKAMWLSINFLRSGINRCSLMPANSSKRQKGPEMILLAMEDITEER